MSAGLARAGRVSGEGGPGRTGVLYVVATPIGNLADLGERARTVLGSVDAVLAEDTRHTRRLFDRHGITARLESFHDHNERRRTAGILARLAAGESFALVSDAGTPLVSDPGYVLMRGAAAANVPVAPIPGPSAFLCALSVAGLPTERFVFEGFLPSRAAARRARLEELAAETRTWAAFEAPHRIRALARDLKERFEPERVAAWARELTKRHEQVRRGPLGELDPDALPERGEYVVAVAGAARAPAVPDAKLDSFLRALLAAAVPVRAAAALARDCLGAEHRRAYRRALALRREAGSEGERGRR